jgi:hypothetical protein
MTSEQAQIDTAIARAELQANLNGVTETIKKLEPELPKSLVPEREQGDMMNLELKKAFEHFNKMGPHLKKDSGTSSETAIKVIHPLEQGFVLKHLQAQGLSYQRMQLENKHYYDVYNTSRKCADGSQKPCEIWFDITHHYHKFVQMTFRRATQAPFRGLQSCASCGQPNTKQKMLLCTGCRVTVYCDKVCQKNHWYNRHKHNCKGKPAIQVGSPTFEIINDKEKKMHVGHYSYKSEIVKVMPDLSDKSPEEVHKEQERKLHLLDQLVRERMTKRHSIDDAEAKPIEPLPASPEWQAVHDEMEKRHASEEAKKNKEKEEEETIKGACFPAGMRSRWMHLAPELIRPASRADPVGRESRPAPPPAPPKPYVGHHTVYMPPSVVTSTSKQTFEEMIQEEQEPFVKMMKGDTSFVNPIVEAEITERARGAEDALRAANVAAALDHIPGLARFAQGPSVEPPVHLAASQDFQLGYEPTHMSHVGHHTLYPGPPQDRLEPLEVPIPFKPDTSELQARAQEESSERIREIQAAANREGHYPNKRLQEWLATKPSWTPYPNPEVTHLTSEELKPVSQEQLIFHGENKDDISREISSPALAGAAPFPPPSQA